MNCDLHNHSIYSDGTFTPEQLVKEAERLGLSAIALTDHNTIMGLDRFFDCGKNSSVKLVGGIEFSTDYKGTELHILGLFVPKREQDNIESIMRKALNLKEQSSIDVVNKLSDMGYDISYKEIKNSSPSGKINRANIASVMVEKNIVESVSEAFEKFLNPKLGLYHPPKKLSSLEIIDVINNMGAVSVLAHPFLDLKTEERLREFLLDAKVHNLDGMEVYYSKFTEEQTECAKKLAEEFSNKAVIAALNVDENNQKASQYFISGIPTILVFKNSKLVEQKAGVHSIDDLKNLIDKHV